jgi:hypothetical protein
MNLVDFIQLGVGGIAIVALVIVVKEFLKFLKKQEDNFTEVIKNHLHTDTEAKNQMNNSFTKLTAVIDQLLRFLERNNKK